MKKYLFLSLVFLLMAGSQSLVAKIRLPQLFQSGMVLQRGKPVPVWGWADPYQKIIVYWKHRQYSTIANGEGYWRLDLPKMKAGGPFTMVIKDGGTSSDIITLSDILVGDVWLCSGQSNIDVTIERVYPQYPDEINHFDNSQVRLFRVKNEANTHGPKDDILPTDINWKPLTRQNAWLFSAIGTFLGKMMQEKRGVPQGVIVNSWGGTPIEAWISADSLRKDYPLALEKTRLYQDDAMVQAQQEANQRASTRWHALLDERDPFPTADDAGMTPIRQYALEQFLTPYANNGQFIGSAWLQQHIVIDARHAGRPARLLLGTLFDQDYTYLNNKEVGRTYYQYPPRRYQIPEGLLREGDNILTVRFVNKYGIPHFIENKPYMLIFGEGDTIRLSEQWHARVGALMPPCPSGDTNLQNMATTLYNAVLHPLAPFAISGVVWYQGESNSGNPTPYADLLRKMMGCWRARWNDPAMPFCIVQLAKFMTPAQQPAYDNWQRLREQQRIAAETDPRAEAVDIFDLGEENDIHPLRKKEAAERIVRCLENLTK